MLCKWLGHRRSKARAYRDPEKRVWKSYCLHCQVPMERDEDGRWSVRDRRSEKPRRG